MLATLGRYSEGPTNILYLILRVHFQISTCDAHGGVNRPPTVLHSSYLSHSVCEPRVSVGVIRQKENGNDHG